MNIDCKTLLCEEGICHTRGSHGNAMYSLSVIPLINGLSDDFINQMWGMPMMPLQLRVYLSQVLVGSSCSTGLTYGFLSNPYFKASLL